MNEEEADGLWEALYYDYDELLDQDWEPDWQTCEVCGELFWAEDDWYTVCPKCRRAGDGRIIGVKNS